MATFRTGTFETIGECMSTTYIYRAKATHDDKVGNDFTVSQDNLDCELTFDEVYVINPKTQRWVSAATVADLNNGNYAAVKNVSFRGLLSNMSLHTPQALQPKTWFIEKEVEHD